MNCSNKQLFKVGDRRLTGCCFGQVWGTIVKVESPEQSRYHKWTYYHLGDDSIEDIFFNEDLR